MPRVIGEEERARISRSALNQGENLLDVGLRAQQPPLAWERVLLEGWLREPRCQGVEPVGKASAQVIWGKISVLEVGLGKNYTVV